MSDFQLDAGDASCTDLVMLIAQRIKNLEAGQTIEVLSTDLAAHVDIPAWCRMTGQSLIAMDAENQPKRFIIQKRQ